MSPKNTASYGKFRSKTLRFLLRCPLVALLSHWIFQSFLYMDRFERSFKLGLDMLLAGGAGLLFRLWLPWHLALISGFLVAHTLNFLFNGHLWGVLKHYGAVSISYDDFTSYIHALAARASRVAAIERVVITGSLARQEWTPRSDLDARLLYRSGALNSLRVCLFTMSERTRALYHRFPLDLYAYDQNSALNIAPGEILEIRMNVGTCD